MRRALRWLASALAIVPFVAACGGGGYGDGGGGGGVVNPPDNTPPVAAATVQATPGLQFTPGSVKLSVGGTITFAFGSVAHNVFFDNAPAGAPANITAPSSNTSVTRSFGTAGRYSYNCHLHPGMSGTIVVQ